VANGSGVQRHGMVWFGVVRLMGVASKGTARRCKDGRGKANGFSMVRHGMDGQGWEGLG
jgi:hypothetical protein